MIVDQKPVFSIKAVGQNHFWLSVLVGTGSAIIIFIFIQQFVLFSQFSYWMVEISMHLQEKEPNLNSHRIKALHQSIAFIAVVLGLTSTTRLLITNKTSNSIHLRLKRDWNSIVLYNHLWSTIHFLFKVLFTVGFFGAIALYIDLKIIVLISLLSFIYFYILSINALKSQFRLKGWPIIILLYSLTLVWGIQQFIRPKYSILQKTKEHKLDLHKEQKELQLIELKELDLLSDQPSSLIK